MAARNAGAAPVCSSPDCWNGWRGRGWKCRGRGQAGRSGAGLHRCSEPEGSQGIGPDSRGCSNVVVVAVAAAGAVARNDDDVAAVGGDIPCSGLGRGRRLCYPGVCRQGAPGVNRRGRGSCSERPGGSGRRQSRGRSISGGGRGSDGWSLAAPGEVGGRHWD